MTRLITLALAAYAITTVVTASALFAPARRWIAEATPRLRIGETLQHPIDCRLCTGFWISLSVCLMAGDYQWILPVYGLSYFMATQERK